MGEISIEYDPEEGTFRADSTVELEMPLLAVPKKFSDSSAEVAVSLVELGSTTVKSVLEALKISPAPEEPEEKAKEEEVPEEEPEEASEETEEGEGESEEYEVASGEEKSEES